MDTMVVYFSRADENWFDGDIRSIPVGNTERAAMAVARAAGTPAFKLEALEPYPANYQACVDRSRAELEAEARPALKALPEGIEDCKTVYLGYPMWCGTAPMPVYTFLEAVNWEGKTIRPFCTHEGSGLGSTLSHLRKACPAAKVEAGLAIVGSEAGSSATEARIRRWVQG